MILQATNFAQSAFAPVYIDGSTLTLRTNGTTSALTIDASQLATFSAGVTAVGTIRANTGFSANGTAGASATVSVRKGDDSGACNLVFTSGLFTSTTC